MRPLRLPPPFERRNATRRMSFVCRPHNGSSRLRDFLTAPLAMDLETRPCVQGSNRFLLFASVPSTFGVDPVLGATVSGPPFGYCDCPYRSRLQAQLRRMSEARGRSDCIVGQGRNPDGRVRDSSLSPCCHDLSQGPHADQNSVKKITSFSQTLGPAMFASQ